MDSWRSRLNYDPIPPLLASRDPALVYFTRRDLLGEQPGPLQDLWSLPEALKILKKQQPDGAWRRPGAEEHPAINYGLIETWRSLRFLVAQYGFTRQNPQLAQAAEFIFTCQSPEGDLRGILANQYATYYTGAIFSLLIEAGYAGDARVEKGLDWLLEVRQQDGGWTIPMQTHRLDRQTQYRLASEYAEPLQADRTKPFAHNATGMVLRAFAAHPGRRHSPEAILAANLLKSRFFQPEPYSSYQDASYWVRFEYPFWWNNLVAALDSILKMDISREDEQVSQALDWLVQHQQPDGLWKVTYAREDAAEKDTPKTHAMKCWVSLAICRLLKN